LITRGYFIGDIIDELLAVAHQVDNRCALGLTDLNIYLENFFKEILNETCCLKLENLNTERCNNPGIDLGDKVKKVAFQVTSLKTSAKINETISTIVENKIADYEKFHILIIGNKQKRYTLNSENCEKITFSERDIWDINRLCKMVIDVPIDILQKLHRYIKKEVARIKIELEIPDPEGNYPTSVSDYVESIPKPLLSSFEVYHTFHKSKRPEWELSLEDVVADFFNFCSELTKLPRITREFYSFLLERRDEGFHEPIGGRPHFKFNDDRLRRVCHYPDIDGEIRLLRQHGFLDINEPYEPLESLYLEIYAIGKSDHFLLDFFTFTNENEIRLKKPIVHLDFSSF
jgi:hypothetical protein